MSSDRISSTGKVVLQSEVFDTNRASGNASTRVFTGSRADMFAQRSVELLAGATTTKLESTGDGNYKLTVGYNFDYSLGGTAGADLPVNIYELENTLEQVDVWNSEVMRGQLLSAFGNWAGVNGAISFLKGYVDIWDAKTPKDSNAMSDVEADFSVVYSGAQKTLMLELFRGIAYHMIRNCQQYNTIYRRRITAASYNQTQAAFVGVGQIWTTAEVINWEGIPGVWWFALPTNVQWLKTKPSVNTVAGQKTEIVYYYQAAAAWWKGTFTPYGSAQLASFYPGT